jgi:hypothetical protein
MKNIGKTLLPVLACILAAGCSNHDESYRISAPDRMEPRKSASVGVSGSVEYGVTFLWTATAGHIEGANDGLTAIFVAPESGSATLLCTISAPGRKTVAIQKQIAVGGSAASSSPSLGSPEVASPGAPGPAGAPMDIEGAGFIPSGWMGDSEGLKVDPDSMDHPHSPPKCQQWSYKPSPRGGAGWAAVAWQFPENNWGDRPGKDWSGRGFRQVSVWARGVRDGVGTLPKLQFKAGGGTAPGKLYQASFEVQGDFVTLTEDWRQYTLDFNGQNLRQVISALVVVIKAQDVGPKGATFYLDDLEYR